MEKDHDQWYYCTIETSDAPVENSIDRPRCEQLVPKSLGYEDVKNSLQNAEKGGSSLSILIPKHDFMHISTVVGCRWRQAVAVSPDRRHGDQRVGHKHVLLKHACKQF
jgi:hypothetical protein